MAFVPAGPITINASATRDNAHVTGCTVLTVLAPPLTFDYTMDSVISLFRRGKARMEIPTLAHQGGGIGGLIEGPLR